MCMRGREELLNSARLQSASTNDGAAGNAPVSSEEPCGIHCTQQDAWLAGGIACSKRTETHISSASLLTDRPDRDVDIMKRIQ